MPEISNIVPASMALIATGDVAARQRMRLEKLIDRLPRILRVSVRWLRQPSSRWARIPIGVLLVIGGLLSFIPGLGIWKLPLGLALLADDVPPLRRARERLLDWVERSRPHWIYGRRPPSPR